MNLTNTNITELTKSKNLFSWTAQKDANPLAILKAKGIYFWDQKNRKFMDFNSQAMCVNIGHGDIRINIAIQKQLEKCAFVYGKEFTTEVRAKLGESLTKILPKNLTKLFFINSGSEANEHAVRIAKNYSGKHKIISRYDSYHGSTYGAISLTGNSRRLSADPIMSGVIHINTVCKHTCKLCISKENCTLDCLNYIEDTIHREGTDNIAAIIIEPIVGIGGVLIPPKNYLKAIRVLCNKYNILMIADEVMTGFGRTGKWFAVDHWDIEPDIMTMAKGLTSGYFPLSAVAVSKQIAEYYDHNIFNSGGTYTAHPVGCAAALACIDVYESDNLIDNSATLGIILNIELNNIKNKYASVYDVRSIGLLGIIEFMSPSYSTNVSLYSKYNTNFALKLKHHLMEKGLFINTNNNSLLIAPPLCITKLELLNGLKIIDMAIHICSN